MTCRVAEKKFAIDPPGQLAKKLKDINQNMNGNEYRRCLSDFLCADIILNS